MIPGRALPEVFIKKNSSECSPFSFYLFLRITRDIYLRDHFCWTLPIRKVIHKVRRLSLKKTQTLSLRSHFFTQSTRFSTDFHLSGTRKCGSSTQCIHVMFLNQFFIYFYLSLCYSLLMEDKCQATWEASSSSSSCNLATTSLNSCHVPFMLNPLHAIIFSLFYCFFMKYIKRTRNLVRYYLSLYRYATLCAKFYYVICIFFIYVVCIGYMLVNFWRMRTSISPLNVNFLAELNFQITKFKE